MASEKRGAMRMNADGSAWRAVGAFENTIVGDEKDWVEWPAKAGKTLSL
mgnify:FL=1